MTREEATKILGSLFLVAEVLKIDKEKREEIKDALNTAIKALSIERTGEWAVAYLDHESVGVRPRTLYCSECNWLTSFPSAWCPNCGADMRGDTE